MNDLLVSDRELAEKVTYHVRLNLNRRVFFSCVKVNRKTQHFGYDYHVTRMCLDRLLPPVLFSRLTNVFKQDSLIVCEPFQQRPALARREEFDELIHGHLAQLLNTVTAIAELFGHIAGPMTLQALRL